MSEMFGQSNESGNRLMFASIVAGKFASKVKEENKQEAYEGDQLKANYRLRKNKMGEEVLEYTFDSLYGKVSRLEFRESNYGEQLNMSITNDKAGMTAVISFNLFNEDGDTLQMAASSLGDQIGLIDFNEEIELGLRKKDGKVKGVAITQNGVYIPSFHDNERFQKHVEARPEATKKETLKGVKWDFSAPSAWQYEQIKASVDRLASDLTSNTVQENAPKDQEDTEVIPF